MKPVLKTLAPILFVCAILGQSCSKGPTYDGKATLVGIDDAQGPCQGGVFIQIDGHTGTYDIGNIPASFQLDTLNHNQDFPIRVLLDYKFRNTGCNNVVDISRITRIWQP